VATSSPVLAVVNPQSGNAAPDAIVGLLRQRFARVELVWPDATDLVGCIQEAFDRHAPHLAVASGGDGTVAAVATAIESRNIVLGIIPTGTANIFARELGVDLDAERACDTLVHGVARRVDALRYGGRRCLCRVGVGVFSEVGRASTTDQKKSLGALAYAKNALPLLLHSPTQRFCLDIDERRVVVEGSSVIVTNTAELGWGRMRWGPTVSIEDGYADVFVISGQTLPENLGVLWSAAEGNALQSEEVTHFAARDHVVVRGEGPTAGVADGEPAYADSHRIEVEPAALRVLVPPAQAAG
jgi:diacylglycerol kinase family enzyme